MDIVQISLLRSFANAVASALQVSIDQGDIHLAHMQSLMTEVNRSVAASDFISAAEEEVESKSLLGAVTSTQISRPEQKISHTVLKKSLFDSGSRNKNRNQPLHLNREVANRFFVQIPWGGHAIEIRLDTTTPKHEIAPELLLHTTAINYFASLPWSSAKLNKLSIGPADENHARASARVDRLGLIDRPDFVTTSLQRVDGYGPTNASGFFAKVPWARASQSN